VNSKPSGTFIRAPQSGETLKKGLHSYFKYSKFRGPAQSRNAVATDGRIDFLPPRLSTAPDQGKSPVDLQRLRRADAPVGCKVRRCARRNFSGGWTDRPAAVPGLCDSPNSWPLEQLEALVKTLRALDKLSKKA